MIKQNAFIEHAENYGNYYGTSKKQIDDIIASKKIPLLNIDIKAAVKIHKCLPQSNIFAVVTPSVATLKARLIGRGTDTEATLATRLGNAPGDLNKVFNSKDIFQYRVINEDLSISISTFSTPIDGLYGFELTGKKQPEIATG